MVLSTSGMANGNFFLLITLPECDQSLNEILTNLFIEACIFVVYFKFLILALQILPTYHGNISAIKFVENRHRSGMC